MYWFNYAIKCVIRKLIYMFMEPRNILILLIVGLVAFVVFFGGVAFGWEGNSNYTDVNNTITLQYDSINQDILNRLNYYNKDNNMYQEFISKLKNNNYSYYAYYGVSDGSSMISGSYYATQEIYIKFYDNEDKTLNGTVYDTYQGMTCSIQYMSGGIVDTYVFNGNILTNIDSQSAFYIPTVLIAYKSPILYSLINDTSSADTQEIIEGLNSIDNSVNELTNTINAKDDNQAISDLNNAYSSMSSSTSGQDTNVTTIHNFYISLSDIITYSLTTTVSSITIPIPFTNKNLSFTSDIIYNIIKGTAIYTLLQLCYYTLFGLFIINQVWRILLWFQSGAFINGKFFKAENLLNDMLM